MNTEIISLKEFVSGSLSATETARMHRDALLEHSKRIVTVKTLEEAEEVMTAMRELKAFTRQIEVSHETVKRPVLELTRAIDALKRELNDDVLAEAERLGKAHGAFQALEKQKADEAMRKAREEEARILREAQEKERAEQEKIRKEEAERQAKERAIQAELDAKAANARTEAGRAKAAQAAEEARIKAAKEAEERAAKAEAEAQQRMEQAKLESVTARVQGNLLAAKAPTGGATRTEPVFEVNDIVALHGAAPYLVIMTPNNAAIKAALKNMAEGTTLPGVTWRMEAKTHVR